MITTSAASEEADAPALAVANVGIAMGAHGASVDAIAHHGGREKPMLAAHGIDFVRRHAVGKHDVEVERGADGLGRGGVIAGDHDDTSDARRPQHADRMRRFRAQFVGQEQRTDRAALDRDKHHQCRPPGGAADDAQRPILRLAMGVDQIT
jgi:hypothetical protein